MDAVIDQSGSKGSTLSCAGAGKKRQCGFQAHMELKIVCLVSETEDGKRLQICTTDIKPVWTGCNF